MFGYQVVERSSDGGRSVVFSDHPRDRIRPRVRRDRAVVIEDLAFGCTSNGVDDGDKLVAVLDDVRGSVTPAPTE